MSCAAVFPEQNERKITKPIAIILLAHLVGDIHQPLHVGAEYFDGSGKVADPDSEKSALADEGGNTFTLELNDEPARRSGVHKKKFHGFWDLDAVNALLPSLPETMSKEERRSAMETAEKKLAHEMATEEPKNWKLPSDIPLEKYGEAWADEILPVAREAHERLAFQHVAPLQEEDRVVAAGEVEEKPESGQAPTANGRQKPFVKNCTRPAGGWPTCWKKRSHPRIRLRPPSLHRRHCRLHRRLP